MSHYYIVYFASSAAMPLHTMSYHHKKVKFFHTRYRALGPELIPVYWQSARRWRKVNHAIDLQVGCRYFLPGHLVKATEVTACGYLRSFHQMALPVNGSTRDSSLLLIYRPRKDERLSWPSYHHKKVKKHTHTYTIRDKHKRPAWHIKTTCAKTFAPTTLYLSLSLYKTDTHHRLYNDTTAQLYIGWQWRNFVPYLCQRVFAAIL